MNWGWRIAIGYSAFVVFILFMVYKATRENFELVTPDYYSKELAFQDQIDKSVNARDNKEEIELIIESDGIALQYPNFSKYKAVSGVVSFFRPSGGSMDRDFELLLNDKGMMYLPISHFTTGRYLFKADWVSDGEAFYIERQIDIP
jgi:hypothetical protein